jgi:hypothetical protein
VLQQQSKSEKRRRAEARAFSITSFAEFMFVDFTRMISEASVPFSFMMWALAVREPTSHPAAIMVFLGLLF